MNSTDKFATPQPTHMSMGNNPYIGSTVLQDGMFEIYNVNLLLENRK